MRPMLQDHAMSKLVKHGWHVAANLVRVCVDIEMIGKVRDPRLPFNGMYGVITMSELLGENWYGVVKPSVASEMIEGEAVIMDLRSGHYFSARDTGALVWDWLDKGHSDRQVAQRLAAQCHIEETEAHAGVSKFISELLAKDLVRISEARDVVASNEPESNVPMAFTPPAIEEFDDMSNLLLLDPIHDVAAVGWPARREDVAQ